MEATTQPAALPPLVGLRAVAELARGEGGQQLGDTLHLPATLGAGTLRSLVPTPGLLLTVHRYTLTRELTLNRPPDSALIDQLLLLFVCYGPQILPHFQLAHTATAGRPLVLTLPAATPLVIVALALERQLLTRWIPDELVQVERLWRSTPGLTVLDAVLSEQSQSTLRQLALPAQVPFKGFFYRIRVQELLYQLLHDTQDRPPGIGGAVRATDAEKLAAARAALVAQLHTLPLVGELARNAGLSESKLRRLFHAAYGSSLLDYFQRARMEEARRQLAHWSVAEVGYHLGFTNLSHFGRLFAKYQGLTPKKYQQTIQRCYVYQPG